MSKVINIIDNLEELDEYVLASVIDDLIVRIEDIGWYHHIDQDEIVDNIASVMESNGINYDIEEVDI